MAIYFGNLDRQLADRQNVIKEDAARQYRGSREVMEAFDDFGTQIASNIEKHGIPKWLGGGGKGTTDLEYAKMDYNVRRQTKADAIRNKEHKDRTLHSQLTNIKGYNEVRLAQHTAMQWPTLSPKSVQKMYDEKVDKLQKDTLVSNDAYMRIRKYPQLFGTEAVKLADEIDRLRRGDVPDKEKAIEELTNRLPLSHLPMMTWAVEQKYFNDKVKGNPLAHGHSMYAQALRAAGYNVPSAEELKNQYAGNSSEKKNLEPVSVQEGTKVDIGNNNIKTLMKRKEEKRLLNEELIEEKRKNEQKELDENAGVFRDDSGGVVSLEGDATGFSKKDTTTTPLYMPDPEPEDSDEPTEEVIPNVPLAPEVIEAEKITTINEAEIRKNLELRRKANTESISTGTSELGVDHNNTFVQAIQELGTDIGVGAKNWGIIGDPNKTIAEINKQNTPVDKEASKKRKEEKRLLKESRRLAADYGRKPNYSTWENVSAEEKSRILEHPYTKDFGASPKSVANLINAEDELEQINNQILYINSQVSDNNKASIHKPNVKWTMDKRRTSYYTPEKYNFSIPVLNMGDISPTDGILSPEAQAAMANVKVQQTKNILKQLPRLESRRNEVAERVKTIENEMMPLTPDIKYRGSLASDFGVSNDYRPTIFRPKTKLPRNVVPPSKSAAENTIDAEMYEAAVNAEKSEEITKDLLTDIKVREGFGPEGLGNAYFDGRAGSRKDGNYVAIDPKTKKGSENLVLAGGNNIYDTINSIRDPKVRDKELADVAYGLFGEGGKGRGLFGTGNNDKEDFIDFMNRRKKDHKAYYHTKEAREKLRLTRTQADWLTKYSMRNHLERLVKKHPYLNNISSYPKEMQVFLMDNTFNMGPGWLDKGKFNKLESHLKLWVNSRSKFDLKNMMKEYIDSDHYRGKLSKNRAQAMLRQLTKIGTSSTGTG